MVFSGSFAFRKATRLVYHISFHLSRGFSKVFQLFSIFVRGLSDCRPSLFRGALVQCSHIIALLPPIVKGFFSTFFTLVLWALCHNFVAAELCMLHMLAALFGGFRPSLDKTAVMWYNEPNPFYFLHYMQKGAHHEVIQNLFDRSRRSFDFRPDLLRYRLYP